MTMDRNNFFDTGIIREVDELGRLVIPKELRDNLDLHQKSRVEIYVVNQEDIIIQKIYNNCFVCGSTTELYNVNSKCICADCLAAAEKAKNERMRD